MKLKVQTGYRASFSRALRRMTVERRREERTRKRKGKDLCPFWELNDNEIGTERELSRGSA